MQVVGEAGDGQEAVRLTAELKPDVVLMDIAMPRLDGIEATKQIKGTRPAASVLVLTTYDDDQFIFSLLEAGAAGYLLKSVRGQELVGAIRAVNAGESVLHPSVARKVLNHFVPVAGRPKKQEAAEALSDREMEIIRLAARGSSNKEIADALCISIRTVQGHLGHIFDKMGVGSRTEAVVQALREGWITLEDVPKGLPAQDA